MSPKTAARIRCGIDAGRARLPISCSDPLSERARRRIAYRMSWASIVGWLPPVPPRVIGGRECIGPAEALRRRERR